MSIEEAKNYYGEELCNLLIKIYDFCKQDGYINFTINTEEEIEPQVLEFLKQNNLDN